MSELVNNCDGMKKKGSTCDNCKRPIGVYLVSCKCGANVCLKCLPPLVHNCTYDYRLMRNKKLINENPTVKPSKIIDF